MMRTIIILAILGCVFQSSQAQFRYADIELKLISHEQYMFIKGPYESVMEFKITNLGPDTIKQKDTFSFSGRKKFVSGEEPREWDLFGLDYDLPPGVSFTYSWPVKINFSRDMDNPLSTFSIGVFTRNNIGDPLADEAPEKKYNNEVKWIIIYRSATSSVSDLHASALNIWPNPANDQLYIDWPEEWESQGNIVSLYNTQGALLHREALEASGDISVSHLPAGLYILELRNKEAVLRKKVLVVR